MADAAPDRPRGRSRDAGAPPAGSTRIGARSSVSACSAPLRGARRAGPPALAWATSCARRWGAAILRGACRGGTPWRRRRAGATARAAPALKPRRAFPSLYDIGVPALQRAGRLAPGDAEAARRAGLLRADRRARGHQPAASRRAGGTGVRAGARPGASCARAASARPDWRDAAQRRSIAHFVARRLSPGGSRRPAGHGAFRRSGRGPDAGRP